MKLTREQLENLLGKLTPSPDGRNLYGRCPYCSNEEFGISLDKENHPFGCYRERACGQKGNIYTLLKHLGKIDLFGERQINIFAPLKPIEPMEDQVPVDELPEIQSPPLWQRVYEDPYLRTRGFTDAQFVQHEVGRSRIDPDYVTFLIRQRGRVVGYVGRSCRSKAEIDQLNVGRKQRGDTPYLRYRNSSSEFGKMLGGLDEVIEETPILILVEGLLSKTKTDANLRLDEYDGIKCCCTFGAKITEDQLALLRSKPGLKTIFLWFEADVLAKVKATAAKLAEEYEVLVGYLEGRDPGDLTPEQALELFEHSVDWFDYVTRYVKNDIKV